MKNLLVWSGRIAVILVAALAVVGITMSVVDTSGTNRFPPERRGEVAQPGAAVGSMDSNAQGAVAPQNGEGRAFRGERHGPQDQSLAARLSFGLLGMLKNFVIIGVVAAIGVGLGRFFTHQPAKAAV